MAFTFFFRDKHTLDLLAGNLQDTAGNSGTLRIWDAGCAMGPEPYTLAIILREKLGTAFGRVHIDATDIDESGHFGEILQAGLYTYADVGRMPEDILQRYFERQDDGRYLIDAEIRAAVHYAWHDLLSLEPYARPYQSVLCKNVLLHFTAEQRVQVIRMYHDVLVPGGYFVTEQTQGMPEECAHLFERIASDANVYRRR